MQHQEDTVIVTRHKALVEYLLQLGLIDTDTPLLQHAAIPDIRGKHVIGVLPLSLAVHAESVTEVPLSIPIELRGTELSLTQLEEYASDPVRYSVKYY